MKKDLFAFFSSVVVVVFVSCYYDITLEKVVTEPVSFSQDILPIFNRSCNSQACHGVGAIPPDLSPANAYNALRTGGYISVQNPVGSELYLWMRGDRALPMPLSGPNATYNATVLAWLEQGALNN